MKQQFYGDLDTLRLWLAVIEDGEEVHYTLWPDGDGEWRVRRATNAGSVEKTFTTATAETMSNDDAWVWFARGLRGIPLRFFEGMKNAWTATGI